MPAAQSVDTVAAQNCACQEEGGGCSVGMHVCPWPEVHWEDSQQGLQHVPGTAQLPDGGAKVAMSVFVHTPKMGCTRWLEVPSVPEHRWKEATVHKLAAVAAGVENVAARRCVACCWVRQYQAQSNTAQALWALPAARLVHGTLQWSVG